MCALVCCVYSIYVENIDASHVNCSLFVPLLSELVIVNARYTFLILFHFQYFPCKIRIDIAIQSRKKEKNPKFLSGLKSKKGKYLQSQSPERHVEFLDTIRMQMQASFDVPFSILCSPLNTSSLIHGMSLVYVY